MWCGAARCEERDASGSLSIGKQFLNQGQVNFTIAGSNQYSYSKDRLGSIRELTKTVGGITAIEAQYNYDPYGLVVKLNGSADAEFQYANYYYHSRSGLNMPVFRVYAPSRGRFVNRDPFEEAGGTNLYVYVGNGPTNFVDFTGLTPNDYGKGETLPFPFRGTAGRLSEKYLLQAINELDPTGSASKSCLLSYDALKAACYESYGPNSIQHQINPCPVAYDTCLTGAVISLLECISANGIDPAIAWNLGQSKQALNEAMNALKTQWDAIKRFRLW